MQILYGSQIALIIIFFLIVILFLLPQKEKYNKLYKFFFIALVIIAITRPETTADTDNYVNDFKHGVDFFGRMEPTLYFISNFARLFPFPVFVGLSIYALLSITPRFVFIKRQSANIWASLMVYMSYCYCAQDIVAIRSGVASAFVLLIIKYKFENNIKYMVASILVATTFHYTALLFFILLIVNTQKTNRILYLAILAGCYALYFVGFDIRVIFPFLSYLSFFETNLLAYDASTEEVFGTLNGPQILRLTTCVLFWIYINKIKAIYPSAVTYLKVFTISLCMFPIFSSINTMGYRCYELFASAEAIGLPMLFMGVFKKKLWYSAAIIVYTFYFFFYVSIFNRAYWDPALF